MAYKDPEERRRKARERYRANPEPARARARRCRPSREELRRRSRAWNKANPEKLRENRRRWRAKRDYGLTLKEYDAIIARGCAICGVSASEARMHLDHDHRNGHIRDALCQSCNHMVGHGQDDPGRLRAAADYVERHRKGN